MQTGLMMNRCATCGQEWWDAHCCPKQMTTSEFFAEAKRLKLRVLGTPEETCAALDLKDAEIARLRAALTALCHAVEHGKSALDPWKAAMEVLGPNVLVCGTQRPALLANNTGGAVVAPPDQRVKPL